MFRAAPSNAANISCGELSRYDSRSGAGAGDRPFAIATAILLAYRSVGDAFCRARGIEMSPRFACKVIAKSDPGLGEADEIHRSPPAAAALDGKGRPRNPCGCKCRE